MLSSSLLLCGYYDTAYDAIQEKFRASLEPSWAMKITRYEHVLTVSLNSKRPFTDHTLYYSATRHLVYNIDFMKSIKMQIFSS